jgi:hypothetical protein
VVQNTILLQPSQVTYHHSSSHTSLLLLNILKMVLGCNPEIEAAHKAANASAKSMSNRGRREAPHNPPPNPPPHKKKKEKITKRKSKQLSKELAPEKTMVKKR